jgi:hypothetical protein
MNGSPIATIPCGCSLWGHQRGECVGRSWSLRLRRCSPSMEAIFVRPGGPSLPNWSATLYESSFGSPISPNLERPHVWCPGMPGDEVSERLAIRGSQTHRPRLLPARKSALRTLTTACKVKDIAGKLGLTHRADERPVFRAQRDEGWSATKKARRFTHPRRPEPAQDDWRVEFLVPRRFLREDPM